MKKFFVAACIATASTAPAFAEGSFETGNAVLAKLKGDSVGKFGAVAYLAGMTTVLRETGGIGGQKEICVPDGVTHGQVIDAIQREIEQNVTTRHYLTLLLAHNAMTKYWPCTAGAL
ncbi:Rap1a/Tai family immunity protein [Variovorax sp. J22R24]|uniref:Rap1a/Tai family immunity protein n=1 Tax=Variovorax gracilis TaxID=3053502 RepID=UPI0025766464|nr:Rap1a/Tai family immunity protein [Variovorax sp. J22R24]MDM0110226.1 Rap1a/Tai family immunity protein [Variovorax sp. J22R24]